MASIIKRGQGYLARVRREGFRPVSKSFIRRTDAVAWGRRVEADMQAGKWADQRAAVPTLLEAIQAYRERVAIKLKGARDYAYAFRELEALPLAGGPVDSIKPAALADWRDALAARGLKPATVARRLGLLSAVLSWCHKERGWLTENPMQSVRRPTVRDSRTRTLDAEEARYVELATAGEGVRAKWLAPAVALLCGAAFRRSELVRLLCADVDITRSVAQLRDSKNGDARQVPLAGKAKEAMASLLADAAAAGRATVLPINDPEALSFAFKRAVARARARYEEDCAAQGVECDPRKLTGIRLHDLRHHAVSEWAKAGLSLGELMLVSGHRSPRMVARYLHMNPEQVAAKMAVAAAVLAAQAEAQAPSGLPKEAA